MRWKVKKKRYTPWPEDRDTRRIRKFLFWPRTINEETRWLCRVQILQTYFVSPLRRIEGCSDLFGYPSYTGGEQYWIDTNWINDD